MTIEKALRIYVDTLNNNHSPNLDYFKRNLANNDFNEFLEIAETINLGKYNEDRNKYRIANEAIRRYKEQDKD